MNQITSIEDINALITYGVLHTLRSLESGTIILEVKDEMYDSMWYMRIG